MRGSFALFLFLLGATTASALPVLHGFGHLARAPMLEMRVEGGFEGDTAYFYWGAFSFENFEAKSEGDASCTLPCTVELPEGYGPYQSGTVTLYGDNGGGVFVPLGFATRGSVLDTTLQLNLSEAMDEQSDVLGIHAARMQAKATLPTHCVTPMRAGVTYARAKPCHRIPPPMPMRAQRSGHCRATFSIDTRGRTTDIGEMDCTMELFSAVAEETVRQWRYYPALRDSRPVRESGVETKLTFVLSNESGDVIPEDAPLDANGWLADGG